MSRKKSFGYYMRKIKNTDKKRFFVYMIMIALALFMCLPLIYLICHSLKPYEELFLFPPRFLVRRPVLDNFRMLFITLGNTTIPFVRYLFNSVFVTVTNVILTIIVCSMGAYVISKFKLRIAGLIFSIVIVALMFPTDITAIPSYILVDKLGIIDTYWALIIPKIAIPFNFFLMKQFIDQYPDENLEAARIDGASEWKIFRIILMPSIKPAWSTLLVFSFVLNWNDYFSSMVYVFNDALKCMPIMLQTIAGGAGSISRQGAVGAASLIMVMPTVIIFVVMQANVLKAMAHSGLKN